MGNYIALDVGGTSINAALVSSDGRLVLPIRRFPAYSDANRSVILDNMAKIINDYIVHAKYTAVEVSGIGIGFPGPFDYENGISLMTGIGKFDSLYGVNIKAELSGMLLKDLEIKFANDADLYCLGECVFGVGKDYDRCMCITLGTGIGSGFFADGRLVTEGPGIPENGWIYKTPYRDGIADDYVSAKWLRRMMKQCPQTAELDDVKELAEAAKQGMPEAIDIFNQFGSMLYEVVVDYAVGFKADCLILGGEISRSCSLFQKPLTEGLMAKGISVIPSVSFSVNTLLACSLI